MGILALVIGLLGGMCGVTGILTALEVAPTIINGEEAIGPIAATTAFWWGLAGILLLASIAVAIARGSGEYE